MTDTFTLNPAKVKALELAANQAGGDSDKIVQRATAFHAFLTGGGATAGTAAPKATPGGKTTTDKATTTGKPADAKTTTTAASGAGKATTNGAAKPGGNANASAIPADTKAPGAKFSYGDVVATLTKVRDKMGKDECYRILAEDGGGAKSVRDLKPPQFDVVVEACNNVLSDEGEGSSESAHDELGLG